MKWYIPRWLAVTAVYGLCMAFGLDAFGGMAPFTVGLYLAFIVWLNLRLEDRRLIEDLDKYRGNV